jgi:hypothetical protein
MTGMRGVMMKASWDDNGMRECREQFRSQFCRGRFAWQAAQLPWYIRSR